MISGRGWSNGSPSVSGAGYGIAISKEDRDRVFKRSQRSVVLALKEGPTVTVRLTDSFWQSCSEFRSREIGRWLLDMRLAPWPKGKPPVFRLEFGREGQLRVSPDRRYGPPI